MKEYTYFDCVDARKNTEEATKLYCATRPRATMHMARSHIDSYIRYSPQTESVLVGIHYYFSPYLHCCALRILSYAHGMTSSPNSLATYTGTVSMVDTADDAIRNFLRRIGSHDGGAVLLADRADGSGTQMPFLKTLDWSSVGMTLEPCASLNNPRYNSDCGLWLLRKDNGQPRRKLEDMQ